MQNHTGARMAALHAFSHPRYFYGQLLQVRHFTAEHDYLNGKNWLLNRYLFGAGVVCGLDVQPDPDHPGSVIVTPGLALDGWGREIVVPCPSKPIAIDPAQPKPAYAAQEEHAAPRHQNECHSDEDWVNLSICFKSCEADPEPMLAAGCETHSACTFGTVKESYLIPPPQDGKLPCPDVEGHFHRCYKTRPFAYGDLVEWVTRGCDPCHDAPVELCVPLANIRRPEPGGEVKEIEIDVRPIVYTSNLLFDLIVSLGTEPPRGRAGKA